MATIYSLICFGGKDGKTVTFTDVGDVVNLANHGLRDGTGVIFSTDDALPTGITAGTTYYSKRGADTGKFTIWTAADLLTQVTFTGTGSGTHTVKGAYWSGLSVDAKARYGSAGSELAYDGLAAWNTARGATSLPTDTEIIELGEAFSDTLTANLAFAPDRAQTIVCPEVNGVKSAAWHAGAIDTTNHVGYVLRDAYNSNVAITLSGFRVWWRDFSVYNNATGSGSIAIWVSSTAVAIDLDQLIFYGSGATGQKGLRHWGNACNTRNCIFTDHAGSGGVGLEVYSYQNKGNLFANLLVVKNETGVTCASNSSSETGGFYYDIISVGNTTNWGSTMPAQISGAANNMGERTGATVDGNGKYVSGGAWTKGTPWYKTSDTGVTGNSTVASDFTDYANDDYTPAAVAIAAQIDAGITVVGMDALDIAGDERPAYNNGNAETWDVGPYEKDLGYTRPQVRNLVIPTLISGSQVQIFTTTTTAALAGSTESSGTSLTQDMGADMTVDVTIMKAGYYPIRIAGIVLDSTTYTLTVDQEIDRTYVAASDLTYTTNATIDRANKEVAINVDSTVQNFRNFCIEQWIDKGANGEALANLDFPFSVNGPNSVTFENGWIWEDWGGGGTGSASIAHLSRDGMRYLNTSGNVVKSWCAVYTPDTTAGLQVQIEQVNGGTIVAADNTGPMDQLVQILGDPNGDGNYADGYDYTGHMQLRVQAVGYTKPLADVYATFGTLEDQLYSIGLSPTAQWPCIDAAVADAAFDNTAKTSTLTADMTMQSFYQGAQYWTNQDAQWDADVPLSSTDGNTYTQDSAWTLYGIEHITDSKTLASGALVVVTAPTTLTTILSGLTIEIPAAGTYTFTAANVTISATPTGASNYVLAACAFTGSNLFWNTTAYNITVEIPAGATFDDAGSPGAGTVTFVAPALYQSVTVSGITTTSRVQIYDTTSSTELYNDVPGATSIVWTDGSAAAADRAIRVRIADCVTTTAKNFIDANVGTCGQTAGTAAVSYLATQTNDTSYNTSAIDGSTVTGITITVGPTRVNIDLVGAGKRSHQQIYAYQVYWQATATGIAQETAFIESPDAANFTYADFRFTNPDAGAANMVTVYNGYGVDSVTGLPEDLIASDSPGIVNVVSPHAVLVTTGSGPLTVGQAAELTAAAASSSTAATQASAVATQVGTAGAGLTAIGDARMANLDAPVSGATAPSAAAVRAEIDSNSTKLAAIELDTNELQTNQGNWVTAAGFAVAGDAMTLAAAYDAAKTAATQASVNAIPTTPLLAASYTAPPSAAAVAAEVLSEAAAAPIAANIKEVNDVVIAGAGTEAVPWGPA